MTQGRTKAKTEAKVFRLVRDVDVSGISGIGFVAEGIVFSDGTCAMRWELDTASTAIYSSIEDVIKIHGHHGATRVVYLAQEAVPHDQIVPSPRQGGR